MSVRFEMRLPDEMASAIDSARGNEPRAAWIKRTLAAALANGGRGEPRTEFEPSHETEPAPQRASALSVAERVAAELVAKEARRKGLAR